MCPVVFGDAVMSIHSIEKKRVGKDFCRPTTGLKCQKSWSRSSKVKAPLPFTRPRLSIRLLNKKEGIQQQQKSYVSFFLFHVHLVWIQFPSGHTEKSDGAESYGIEPLADFGVACSCLAVTLVCCCSSYTHLFYVALYFVRVCLRWPQDKWGPFNVNRLGTNGLGRTSEVFFLVILNHQCCFLSAAGPW